MRYTNGVIHWDILFARSVLDWEMKILQYFIGLLYSHKIDRARNDQIWWIPARSSIFQLKSCCKAFANENFIEPKMRMTVIFST